MSKWFNVYLLMAIFCAGYIELCNYEKITGLGLVTFLLIMILYYSFPKERKKK